MDRDGHVGFALNTAGMFRGSVSKQAPAAIYADEKPTHP
jgi:beta-aspartyl-peptidase (threonine type)